MGVEAADLARRSVAFGRVGCRLSYYMVRFSRVIHTRVVRLSYETFRPSYLFLRSRKGLAEKRLGE